MYADAKVVCLTPSTSWDLWTDGHLLVSKTGHFWWYSFRKYQIPAARRSSELPGLVGKLLLPWSSSGQRWASFLADFFRIYRWWGIFVNGRVSEYIAAYKFVLRSRGVFPLRQLYGVPPGPLSAFEQGIFVALHILLPALENHDSSNKSREGLPSSSRAGEWGPILIPKHGWL